MALWSHNTEPVCNESLGNWKLVDSGGFGCVYKARHKDWKFDVAIKISRSGDCRSIPLHSLHTPLVRTLSQEARHMDKVSCEFVLKVYGIYEGCPPFKGSSMQRGIVMEFMERGSLQSLLNKMQDPLPFALTFRLAHQVALGMNFLHSKGLMHHDLKPSNVLLNNDLNAKLADFGLSRVSTSALTSNRELTGESGGTYKYMPPEAFETTYEPVRAFDRYSYGILLWSIVTGKEPYPDADYNLVALKIPKGDRPPCEDIDQTRVEGLKELVVLMKRCWEKEPSERPHFEDCLEVTESLYSKHRKGIHEAVYQVLKRLDSATSSQRSKASGAFDIPPQTPERSKSNDEVDNGRFAETPRPVQDVVSVSTREMTDGDKARFVDDKRAALIQNVAEVMAIVEELGNMVHAETYSRIAAAKTSQEQLRELYNGALRPGGEMVKAAFYNALKTIHPQLVERLGG